MEKILPLVATLMPVLALSAMVPVKLPNEPTPVTAPVDPLNELTTDVATRRPEPLVASTLFIAAPVSVIFAAVSAAAVSAPELATLNIDTPFAVLVT